jgi:hypothetical protein
MRGASHREEEQMKTIMFTALAAVALLLAVGPAMAADQSTDFVAFKALDQAQVVPLSDRELSAVEGKALCVCINIGVIPQINVNPQIAVLSPGASLVSILTNSAGLVQFAGPRR